MRSVLTSAGTAAFDVVSVQSTRSVPKNAETLPITAVDQKPWPDGYSGWFTEISGRQAASPAVSGLPSSSASGIAVRGRQAR